jgi:exosortase C (VPDSG-CTERM-specific)
VNKPVKLTKEENIIPREPSELKPDVRPKRWRHFMLAVSVLVLCFGVPLGELARFAAGSKLFSYILLIPFISFYLVWLRRRNLPSFSRPARKAGGFFLLAGGGMLATYWLVLRPQSMPWEDGYLALMTISFLLFFMGICCLFWGRETLCALAFPLAFLVFMVPIPAFVVLGIDSFLQRGSAVVAQGFFNISGMPFWQDGLAFQLPGITLRIAPECSGIHSSLVLFITSLLASYLLLQTGWKRAVLVLVVIPLALLRNGFRVFVLGELCVHIGPQMIDSPIHHKGGPIFFILSLIPLFLLLMALQKSERALNKPQPIETDHA